MHSLGGPVHAYFCELSRAISPECFYPFNDFGYEERKDKKTKREEYLPANQASPFAARPDVSYRPDKKSENEGADDYTQGRPAKIIPETNPGQSHAEVHGGKREVDKAQVKDRGETVSLDGLIVFP